MRKFYRKIRGRHDVAYWVGTITFFTSMMSFGAVNKFDLHAYEEFVAALFVSLATSATVFSRQRLYEAERNGEKIAPSLLEDPKN